MCIVYCILYSVYCPSFDFVTVIVIVVAVVVVVVLYSCLLFVVVVDDVFLVQGVLSLSHLNREWRISTAR